MNGRGVKIALRVVTVLMFVMMTVGFRTMGTARWGVTHDDPTIWVQLCEGMSNIQFEGADSDLPPADPLRAAGDFSIGGVLQSILDDYNGITTWYVKLAPYPSDPNNPPAPQPGQSTFTGDAAARRTIHVCTGTQPGVAVGGHSRPRLSGDTIVGCDISLGSVRTSCVSCFLRTLTHEMGHCFYLTHPQESTHAVMSYFSGAKRLMDDDKVGLTYFYPIDQAGLEQEKWTGGFSCSQI